MFMHAKDHIEIKERYRNIVTYLDEKRRRLWAANEAMHIGFGGISVVSRATGLTRKTIREGIHELDNSTEVHLQAEKQRRSGAGRLKIADRDPRLKDSLEILIEPYVRGDPMSSLRWTCKSTRRLAEELGKQGHPVSARTVAKLLKEMHYSLQSSRKRFEGAQHPDRNGQFEYINKTVQEFQRQGSPVISVDAKKKELVGNYKNAGREWHKHGQAPEVNAYDFPDKALGKAIPYGVYDPSLNEGWVSVGTDHDTAEFAVETIWRWWAQMGEFRYPAARELLILADGGGSNGRRNRLWKCKLQDFASEENLKVMVCHFPPGTSKWNKIEHQMFSHISKNWRGHPLTSHEVVVNLIAGTTTQMGLKINAKIDQRIYRTGIKIHEDKMAKLKIQRAEFHGEWNYVVFP